MDTSKRVIGKDRSQDPGGLPGGNKPVLDLPEGHGDNGQRPGMGIEAAVMQSDSTIKKDEKLPGEKQAADHVKGK